MGDEVQNFNAFDAFEDANEKSGAAAERAIAPDGSCASILQDARATRRGRRRGAAASLRFEFRRVSTPARRRDSRTFGNAPASETHPEGGIGRRSWRRVAATPRPATWIFREDESRAPAAATIFDERVRRRGMSTRETRRSLDLSRRCPPTPPLSSVPSSVVPSARRPRRSPRLVCTAYPRCRRGGAATAGEMFVSPRGRRLRGSRAGTSRRGSPGL